ncbi:MAG: carbamoyltransferase HypF [Nitrospirota bacterium]|nr:carbamoyltransferase HypF [Nitrospirota bacterium]
MECLGISIRGIVQGVGFRPFVYNLANRLSVKGFITNTTDGVMLNVEGENLDTFIERIRGEAPPLAQIMSIDISPAKYSGFGDFSIRESAGTGRFTLLSPDISVCSDCLMELLDRQDRRFRYPFINCTNCGPRYSITRKVPYDRVNTTMKAFHMCEECLNEYHDPENRRFHAQPNACPSCGPGLELIVPGTIMKIAETDRPLEKTRDLLRQGKIVAIKGLGGFHIACDAANSEAVESLRERKRRNNKPFALMAPDVSTIRKYCFVSEDEEKKLLSHKRPVVLLQKRDDHSLPEGIAPNNRYTGFMLPYTPLHYLLFDYPDSDDTYPYDTGLSVLVMTSGNISEEPIIHDNEEALVKLSGIADAFLVHNRDIFMKTDDSVLKMRKQVSGSGSQHPLLMNCAPDSRTFFIRRSRGYVPEPVPLLDDGPDVLGCGADLKNTFTITKGAYAIPSQHIGDMENYETLRFYEETLENLKSVYHAHPEAVAYDLHPHYMSTQWALNKGSRMNGRTMKTLGVQHHYAHIASVMAENGIRERVIGVAFDGNGYGEDGSLWGGEFLLADIYGYKRAGHIRYTSMPGGEMAAREPWRMAISYLNEAAGDQLMDFIGPTNFLQKYGSDVIEKILKIGPDRKFSPLTSSAGRLFDAAAALLGICDKNTFEGEAAIALESMITEGISEYYPADISFREPVEIDFSHVILKIIEDMGKGVETRVISTKFHNSVAASIIHVALKLALINNIRKIILSGGVFQNLYLLGKVMENLKAEGLSVYVNEMVPCNDAGISLGQAYIVRERLKTGAL